MKYGIHGVLAGAYRGKDIGERALHTHVAVYDDAGYVARTLCRRVKPDNMADDDAGPVPTCPECAKRLPRFIVKHAAVRA
jgi:hypothetical protein